MKNSKKLLDWKSQSIDSKNDFRNTSKLPEISSKNFELSQLSSRLNRMTSSDLSKFAEEVQQDVCKLIVFPEQQIEDGFKTFSEMMISNKSWATNAYRLKKLSNASIMKTEPSISSCSILPDYLKYRLQFNQAQAESYSVTMNDQWIQTMENMKNQYLKGAKEEYRLPKVRLVLSDKKGVKTNDDKIKDEDDDDEENKLFNDNNHNIKLKNLKFFWYQLQITENWKPAMREGTVLPFIPNLNKCIMYGGRGTEVFNSIVTLDTCTWQWTDLGLGTGDVPLEGRFGHTANVFRKVIVVFGGEKLYNSHMKMRECFSEIRVYNPFEHSWKYPRVFGDIVDGRRNHCAAVLGRFLFIFGGINSYGKYLKDVCSLNLETYKWALYEVNNFYQEGIAFAQCVPLFKYDIKINNPIIGVEYIKIKGKRPLKLLEEGIYIFGGQLSNGEALKELRVLKLGSKILQSKVLETKGIAPSARYMHSMNHYEQLNLLIIYGGKDDNCPMPVKNDMFALDLENLVWITVDHQNQLLTGKCNHCSVFLETKFLIFGGYSQNVYENSALNIVEFDQTKSRLMMKEVNLGGLKKRNSQQESIVFTTKDLQSDQSLKIFAMDMMSQSNIQMNEEELRKKRLKDKEIERLSFKHFKSFLPLPVRETSTLMKEFRMKKEMSQQHESSSSTNLIRRPSSKMSSFQSAEKKTVQLEQLSLKIQTSIEKQRLSMQLKIQEFSSKTQTQLSPLKESVLEVQETEN